MSKKGPGTGTLTRFFRCEKGFLALPEEEPARVEVKMGKAPAPSPRKPISIKLPSVQRTWQLLFVGAILAVIGSAILMSMSSRYYLLNQGYHVYRIDRWTGKTEFLARTETNQKVWVPIRARSTTGR